MFGQGSPFFGNMNVSQMHVNFNFAGQQGMVPNPMSLNHFPQNNNQLGMQQPAAIGYQEPELEMVDAEVVEDTLSVSLKFHKCYIDKGFKLHFDKSFDYIGNKPKSKIENSNPHYRVRTNLAEFHVKYGDEVFSDIEIREKLPLIVTIINIDHIEEEDLNLVDQILYHASLLSVMMRQPSFFIILEETGSTGFGEPIMSHINGKGIFHKTVYSITVPENFSKKN